MDIKRLDIDRLDIDRFRPSCDITSSLSESMISPIYLPNEIESKLDEIRKNNESADFFFDKQINVLRHGDVIGGNNSEGKGYHKELGQKERDSFTKYLNGENPEDGTIAKYAVDFRNKLLLSNQLDKRKKDVIIYMPIEVKRVVDSMYIFCQILGLEGCPISDTVYYTVGKKAPTDDNPEPTFDEETIKNVIDKLGINPEKFIFNHDLASRKKIRNKETRLTKAIELTSLYNKIATSQNKCFLIGSSRHVQKFFKGIEDGFIIVDNLIGVAVSDDSFPKMTSTHLVTDQKTQTSLPIGIDTNGKSTDSLYLKSLPNGLKDFYPQANIDEYNYEVFVSGKIPFLQQNNLESQNLIFINNYLFELEKFIQKADIDTIMVLVNTLQDKKNNLFFVKKYIFLFLTKGGILKDDTGGFLENLCISVFESELINDKEKTDIFDYLYKYKEKSFIRQYAYFIIYKGQKHLSEKIKVRYNTDSDIGSINDYCVFVEKNEQKFQKIQVGDFGEFNFYDIYINAFTNDVDTSLFANTTNMEVYEAITSKLKKDDITAIYMPPKSGKTITAKHIFNKQIQKYIEKKGASETTAFPVYIDSAITKEIIETGDINCVKKGLPKQINCFFLIFDDVSSQEYTILQDILYKQGDQQLKSLFILREPCGITTTIFKYAIDEYDKLGETLYKKKLINIGKNFTDTLWYLRRKNLEKMLGVMRPSEVVYFFNKMISSNNGYLLDTDNKIKKSDFFAKIIDTKHMLQGQNIDEESNPFLGGKYNDLRLNFLSELAIDFYSESERLFNQNNDTNNLEIMVEKFLQYNKLIINGSYANIDEKCITDFIHSLIHYDIVVEESNPIQSKLLFTNKEFIYYLSHKTILEKKYSLKEIYYRLDNSKDEKELIIEDFIKIALFDTTKDSIDNLLSLGLLPTHDSENLLYQHILNILNQHLLLLPTQDQNLLKSKYRVL